MSKVLKRIKAQIKRDGELPEHLEVLKLYNLMIANGLCSSMLWNKLTNCRFEHDYLYVYSVKPEVIKLIETWNL